MKKVFYLSTALLFFFNSCNFAPGSYPYAEIYEFEVDEVELINAVQSFKRGNPEFSLSNTSRFLDGRRDEKDPWYHIWFYYANDGKVLKCWVRGNKLALVGIGDDLDLDNYKEINKDFSKEENKEEKEKFEKLILKKIKENL